MKASDIQNCLERGEKRRIYSKREMRGAYSALVQVTDSLDSYNLRPNLRLWSRMMRFIIARSYLLEEISRGKAFFFRHSCILCQGFDTNLTELSTEL